LITTWITLAIIVAHIEYLPDFHQQLLITLKNNQWNQRKATISRSFAIPEAAHENAKSVSR
jgi:hypothetical protein